LNRVQISTRAREIKALIKVRKSENVRGQVEGKLQKRTGITFWRKRGVFTGNVECEIGEKVRDARKKRKGVKVTEKADRLTCLMLTGGLARIK